MGERAWYKSVHNRAAAGACRHRHRHSQKQRQRQRHKNYIFIDPHAQDRQTRAWTSDRAHRVAAYINCNSHTDTHRHTQTHTDTQTHTHSDGAHRAAATTYTRHALPNSPSAYPILATVHASRSDVCACYAACTYSPPTPTAHTLPSHTHTAHKCCTLACMLDSACLETLRVEQHRRLPGRPTASARRTIFAEIRQRICRAHA